jgi:hypothetical protein
LNFGVEDGMLWSEERRMGNQGYIFDCLRFGCLEAIVSKPEVLHYLLEVKTGRRTMLENEK